MIRFFIGHKEPKPFVYQTSLPDFCVEYQLNAYLERPETRIPTPAELHSKIQDSFNKHGVQVPSPHYESDPADKVWVPKEKWFDPRQSQRNKRRTGNK